jgi:UrcA family protein
MFVCSGHGRRERRAAERFPPSLRVIHADLDLRTDQDVRTLYASVADAAQAVCPQAQMDNLSLYVQSRACLKQAIARAVRQVGNPQLAAIFAKNAERG